MPLRESVGEVPPPAADAAGVRLQRLSPSQRMGGERGRGTSPFGSLNQSLLSERLHDKPRAQHGREIRVPRHAPPKGRQIHTPRVYMLQLNPWD